MTVRQILQRLDRRSVNVPATPRHGVSRQATMEEAIWWSFDLLEPADQTVLTRLSVFVGGFTMEATEAVAGWGAVHGDEVFDAVLRSVHASLVEARRHADGQVRYRMLMVLRRFGHLELEARGEAAEVDMRHAESYAGVAEAIAPHLEGRRASRSREIANMSSRACALPWSRRSGSDASTWRCASMRPSDAQPSVSSLSTVATSAPSRASSA